MTGILHRNRDEKRAHVDGQYGIELLKVDGDNTAV